MTHTGKIARLPHALREQLNHRLRDAEPAESLLAWLNALPEVQQILADQFEARPINPQNLSEWRTGAFAEWSLRQEILGSLQYVSETAAVIDEISSHHLIGQLLTLLTAHYARFLNHWDGEVSPAITQQLKALSRLTRDLNILQKSARPAAPPVRHGPGEGESDRIKPNQPSPGVVTARHHITTSSTSLSPLALAEVEPAQSAHSVSPDTRHPTPDPVAVPQSNLIRLNQGQRPKTLADLSPENIIPTEFREILDDPGIRQRLQEVYDAAIAQTGPGFTGQSDPIKPNQGCTIGLGNIGS